MSNVEGAATVWQQWVSNEWNQRETALLLLITTPRGCSWAETGAEKHERRLFLILSDPFKEHSLLWLLSISLLLFPPAAIILISFLHTQLFICLSLGG